MSDNYFSSKYISDNISCLPDIHSVNMKQVWAIVHNKQALKLSRPSK